MRLHFLFAAYALLLLADCAGHPGLPSGDARIESLLGRMTVEEKVGQLSLYAPAGVDIVGNPQAAQQSLERQLADIRAGRVTGLFNDEGLEGKRRAQEAAVNGSRLGIPLIFGADVIHGFRTVFPVPLAEAASWEPGLAERTTRAAAEEATADGFRWTFAPMVDIARDARWGRGVEGAGEDVLLGRLFAAARVRGFQGPDLSRPDAMLATPKHFAGYGAAEAGLDYNTVDLSERTLREVYLPPFHAAIDAGALSIMAAFNEIGGIPSNANHALLTGVLRDEWGFQGFVVSDYTADQELVAHGFAADGREAARRAFLAGTDVSMQSGLYMRWLPELVAAGEVPMARLDDAVRRVLRVKQRLGLFDHPMRGLDGPSVDAPPLDMAAHQALAREAAVRSIVLLKNEGGLLPLHKAGQRIALIGPFAGRSDLFGPWMLFPGQAAPVGIEDALRAAMADPTLLTVVRGADVEAPLPGGIAAAVAAAQAADVVLLSIGEDEAMSGEARSRSDIEVPAAQQALADAVVATGKPVVVLLRNGRALALKDGVRRAQALLVTWFLGSQTGPAVADILFGDASPSARLPVSFPQTPGQVPYYYAHKRTGRPELDADPNLPYRARYLAATNEPLYPFGFGLGYAPVRYTALDAGPARLPWNGTLDIKARISNEGRRDVEETAQLYIEEQAASVTRPVRELKAFRKVHVPAGGSAEVDFSLSRADLMFIGQDLRPTVEPGRFELWVGPSAAAGLHAGFELLPP